MQIVNTLYVLQTGSRGNDIHVTYTTYMVYDVQKCSLYDGFVRPWKWTFTDRHAAPIFYDILRLLYTDPRSKTNSSIILLQPRDGGGEGGGGGGGGGGGDLMNVFPSRSPKTRC
jgi:hypothetical protein